MFEKKSNKSCWELLFNSKKTGRPFKDRKPFDQRVAEVAEIKATFPTKIPVIVERHKKEHDLPGLDKCKFLVPKEISTGQFVAILRSRLRLAPSKSLFLLVDGKALPDYAAPLGECYEKYQDPDGFLYLHYAAQEAFG